jgi:membrane associated rhomboid family serine protease
MTERFRFFALWLCAVCVAVFILQLVIPGFTELFLLTPEAWPQGWRFVSAVFLHGGVGHLLYNLLALGLFGSMLERLVGSRRFLLVFFVSGIVANILSVNFYDASLGASGAIFGVIGALIMIRPGLPVFAFGFPMPIFIAGILWVAGDVLGAVGYMSGNPINNTGNFAHLSGMIVGLVMGFFYRRRNVEEKSKTQVLIHEGSMRAWEDQYIRPRNKRL